jgi:hypothetical protein
MSFCRLFMAENQIPGERDLAFESRNQAVNFLRTREDFET